MVFVFKTVDSLLAFKKRMKVGRFSEKDPKVETALDDDERAFAEAVSLGSRCEVTIPGALPKRGTVMFIGEPKFFISILCNYSTSLYVCVLQV